MLPFQQQPGNSGLLGLVIANTSSAPISRKLNLAASADPSVNDDSSAGYGIGSFWINTLSSKIFFCSDASVGAANWINSSGGSTSKETITAANSFSAGDIIQRTSGGYTKAQADSASDAEVLGVIEAATGSQFTIVYFGKLSYASHGFTVGAVLFLSAATAGLLTATEPTTAGQVSKPVAVVLDADNLLILNMRGLVIGVGLPLTTKGDIFTNDGSGNARLAVGTNGQYLKANSAASTGLQWGDPVTSVDASGGVETVSGSAITTTGTVRGAHLVNAQTGTTYTYQTGDRGKLVSHSNASAIAGTLPQASASFPSGWFVDVQNTGAGTLTITPTTSTIDGVSSIVLVTGQGVRIYSDGTNYFSMRGGSGTQAFFSSVQTLTANALLTIAHGLSATPSWFSVSLINVTTDLDWSTNDEVFIDHGPQDFGAGGYGMALYANSTNILVRVGPNILVGDKLTGVPSGIDMTKWKLKVRAHT
jgi:hypothetical protein